MFFFWCNHLQAKERLTKLLRGVCKCSEGNCFQQFNLDETKNFLDAVEARSKVEQDTILFLAWSDASQGYGFRTSRSTRREFFFLGKYMKRVCFEALLGVSSHRIDKIGAIDQRFGQKDSKPSKLGASIDSFCLILYNSVAEPLPNKLHATDLIAHFMFSSSLFQCFPLSFSMLGFHECFSEAGSGWTCETMGARGKG